MKNLTMISICTALLFGCTKSDFEKCLSAERTKLSTKYEENHSSEQLEVVNEILPIFFKFTDDLKPLGNEYYAADENFGKEYISKGGTYGAAYYEALKEDRKNRPNAATFRPFDLALERLRELVARGAFETYDPGLMDKYGQFCVNRMDVDPYCLDTPKFWIPEIRSAFVNEAKLSSAQFELVYGILPILLKDTNDFKPLWNEYYAADENFRKEYISKGGTYGAAYDEAFKETEKSFPHAAALKEFNLAYGRLWDLKNEGAFDTYDPDLGDKYNQFCEDRIDVDPYCLDTPKFYISEIRSAFSKKPNFEAIAVEICNSRGLY